MADKTIGELERAESIGLGDLFVLQQANQAKSLTGQTLLSDLAEALEGHGGISSISLYSTSELNKTYEIVYADLSVSYFTVTDGNSVTGITQYYAVSNSNSVAPSTWYTTMQTMTTTNRYLWGYQRISFTVGSPVNLTPSVIGVYGDTGLQTNVYFKWSVNQPQSNSDMIDTPAAWVGVCSTTAPSAPTDYTLYRWYQYKGETGDGIASISKTGTSGLVDTYTVVLDSGATSTFDVTNGSSIASISKTATVGIVDTYTVTLTNGQTTTFDVTNGNGVTAIIPVSALHIPGQLDTYRIVYGNGDTFTFDVYNGANGSGAVSSVSGIQPVNGDVPQIVSGSGAPTVLTQGQENQLYFDEVAGGMYFCLGQDPNSTDYIWVGTSVAVDSALSTTSENPVQNKVITGKIGTAALNTTAQNLSGAVNELLGDIPAPSSSTPGADTASGAVGVGTTYARADHRHPINVPSSGTPANLGVANNGSAATYARSDHVHNLPSGLVPSGGSTGQFLAKSSGSDYALTWKDGSTVYVGASAPTDPAVDIWLDTDEPGMSAVSSVNGRTGPVVLDAPVVGAMSKWVKLWENASTTSAFSAQTISVDLSDYDFVCILYYDSTPATHTTRSFFAEVGTNGMLDCTETHIMRRSATVNTSGVVFGNGTYMGAYPSATMTDYNDFCIPYKIYGIKGVVT